MAERSNVSLNPDLMSHEMLRESCLSTRSIDLSLELGAEFAYLPAIYYSSYIEGQWVGGKPRIEGFLGSGWMHVVVSSSCLFNTISYLL